MIEKIKDWLYKQGYPLEMNVANELLKNGFNTLQSSYYSDPKSEKQREIDVVGHLGFAIKEYLLNFQFIIECKNNSSKPWLTFSSDSHRLNDKDLITKRPSSKIGNKYLEFLYEKKYLESLELFKRPTSFAYNAAQSFENESDRVYLRLARVCLFG